MCIVNFHFHKHPIYKLIVVANRDEYYERPTKSACFWEDELNILAGRDLLQKGTWLGISREGKFAAITNYRDPSLPETGRYSRGEIIRNYLTRDIDSEIFIKHLIKNRANYGGYNIIFGNQNQLFHYNNILNESNVIDTGTHSVSNHSLNTPWPKVVKGKSKLQDYVQSHQEKVHIDDLFQIVADRSIAKDAELPHTGVGLRMERLLSPLFVKMENYGTRSSTILLIDKKDQVTYVERTFLDGEFQYDKQYKFSIES